MNEIVSRNPMKRKVIFFLFLSTFTGSVFSQFDAQLSQYMLNHTAFNPAAVGESGMIDATLQHRFNMLGFPNAGSTTVASINSPIKLGDSMHGLGFSALNDAFGLFSNKTFHLQYAYKQNLGEGKLSIGTDVGLVSLGFSGDSLSKHTIDSQEYPYFTTDPEVPTTSVVGMGFDMSLGVWYSTKKWYAGASYAHLNQPTVRWGDATEFKQYSTLYLTSGLTMPLNDPKYVLKPSMMFKSDFTAWELNLSTRVEYDNKFWGGLSYRYADAFVLLAGINIADGLSVGYSADLSTNKLITTNYGSHEFVLTYSFEYVFAKGSTKYKSIRFL